MNSRTAEDLWTLIRQLAFIGAFVENTNHLSHEELYARLREQLDYATEEDRREWRRQFPDEVIPPREVPPYDRDRHLPMLSSDPQSKFFIRRWLNDGSALPLVQRLIELGCDDEAAATARLALKVPDCEDREELEAALGTIASEPDGWSAALEKFASNPSLEEWETLMRFVPEEIFYQRLRTTVPLLMRLGCDGNVLFRCASKNGVTPDLFDLAASGTVNPEVIEERGDGSPARPCWLGLASQAAFARGDRFGTLRYLREAMRDDENAYLAWASISEIRAIADEAFNEELDRLEIPRL